MIKIKEYVRGTPLVRDVFLFVYRLKSSLAYLIIPIREFIIWLFRSKEFANYTYHLTDRNKRYLASTIASITGQTFQEVAFYIDELENDQALRTHIQRAIQTSNEKYFADMDIKYGRRLGWYVFVRVLKPSIVVETGVDKGMGSCILTAALIRNEKEGFSGFYYGTDINPRAGYLLTGNYKNYGEILYGDSIDSLAKLDKIIDLFINDSDHSTDYEESEYATIAGKLSSHAIVLGDNAHCSDKLLDFALSTDRQFVFFREEPLKHWYPGAGIGIAFKKAFNS